MGIRQCPGIGNPVDRDARSKAVQPIHHPVLPPLLVLPGRCSIAVIDQRADQGNPGKLSGYPGNQIRTPEAGNQQIRLLPADQAHQAGDRQREVVRLRDIQKNKPDPGFFIFLQKVVLRIEIDQRHLGFLRKPGQYLQVAAFRSTAIQCILGKKEFQSGIVFPLTPFR